MLRSFIGAWVLWRYDQQGLRRSPSSRVDFVSVEVLESGVFELKLKSIRAEPLSLRAMLRNLSTLTTLAPTATSYPERSHGVSFSPYEKVDIPRGCQRSSVGVFAICLAMAGSSSETYAPHHLVAKVGELLNGEMRQG